MMLECSAGTIEHNRVPRIAHLSLASRHQNGGLTETRDVDANPCRNDRRHRCRASAVGPADIAGSDRAVQVARLRASTAVRVAPSFSVRLSRKADSRLARAATLNKKLIGYRNGIA